MCPTVGISVRNKSNRIAAVFFSIFSINTRFMSRGAIFFNDF